MSKIARAMSRMEPVHANKPALDAVIPQLYRELRRIASSLLRGERSDHTLQPTALVHEVYLRLLTQHEVNWENRTQVVGLSVQMMRRILVNHAAAHNAIKRDPGIRLTLENAIETSGRQDPNILALHEALNALAKIDFEKSQIVELRFFGGLTMTEIAQVVGRSVATVEREWSFAKAWLFREMDS
jgi:RNA polymerase sigma factor (TIGR02999 family)